MNTLFRVTCLIGMVLASTAALVGCAAQKATAAPTKAEQTPAPVAASVTPRRELPSLAAERARPAASAAALEAGHHLPSLADEQARTSTAPIALPDSPPAGLSAKPGYPDWWLTGMEFSDGRYAACAEGDGVSFIGARQVALDQAVANLRESLKGEPSDLKTERITSVQSGGMFRVRVRVSCAAP